MELKPCFFEAFANMQRLGPGSTESTQKSMAIYPKKDEPIQILDVGCGVGTPAFLLAENFLNATIIGIDNHMPFIEQLNRSAKEKGLENRLSGLYMSMFEMTFPDESFDLIWSEGSIFITGFEQGINDWKRLLKAGGYLVCSEASWLTDSPAEKIYNYWHEQYPEIDTVSNQLKIIEKAGYALKGHFVLPVTDWTENYYDYMQINLDVMRKKYAGNMETMECINMFQLEIDMYHKYSDAYSYVFYVMEIIILDYFPMTDRKIN